MQREIKLLHGFKAVLESGTWRLIAPKPLPEPTKKWEAIVAWYRLQDMEITPEDVLDDCGPSTCFYCHQHAACHGCPIMVLMGKRGCQGTPYIDYFDAVTCGDVKAAKKAAEEELLFLRLVEREVPEAPRADALTDIELAYGFTATRLCGKWYSLSWAGAGLIVASVAWPLCLQEWDMRAR